MSKNNNIALIYYLGENKPNLITDVTNYLTEMEGDFSGVTFATLGRGCELTMIYEKDSEINLHISSLEWLTPQVPQFMVPDIILDKFILEMELMNDED